MSALWSEYQDFSTMAKPIGGPKALIAMRQAEAVAKARPSTLMIGGAAGILVAYAGSKGLEWHRRRQAQRAIREGQ